MLKMVKNAIIALYLIFSLKNFGPDPHPLTVQFKVLKSVVFQEQFFLMI